MSDEAHAEARRASIADAAAQFVLADRDGGDIEGAATAFAKSLLPVIDDAYLAGIAEGLEAAARECDAYARGPCRQRVPGQDLAALIRALDPATIAAQREGAPAGDGGG